MCSVFSFSFFFCIFAAVHFQSCIEFYYHMFGPSIGQLSLIRINHDNNDGFWRIWSRTGSQGNRQVFYGNETTNASATIFYMRV